MNTTPETTAATPRHTYQVLTKRADRLAMLSDPKFGRLVADWVGEHPVFTRISPDARWTMPWPLPNVWLGVSVESQQYADERIPHLLRAPAAIRFLSVEPQLEHVDLNRAAWGEGHPRPSLEIQARQLTPKGDASWQEGFTPLRAIDWVIVGGESGTKARPFDLAWARSIIAQCRAAKVPVFVKQLGNKPTDARTVDEKLKDLSLALTPIRSKKGGDMAEWPSDLRVREMPITPGHLPLFDGARP